MEKSSNLIGKDVIKYSEHEKRELIPPILFRSKSDETSRLILNLKTFNEFLEHKYLKMETVHLVADMIQPRCCMISIDLKDTYRLKRYLLSSEDI